LHPWEEKALAKFITCQDTLGSPVWIKYIGSVALSIACRRTAANRPSEPPGKN
ncbi:hypothetical protein EJ04DRAFT_399169, partial [Polyplosphaeria fusca]